MRRTHRASNPRCVANPKGARGLDEGPAELVSPDMARIVEIAGLARMSRNQCVRSCREFATRVAWCVRRAVFVVSWLWSAGLPDRPNGCVRVVHGNDVPAAGRGVCRRFRVGLPLLAIFRAIGRASKHYSMREPVDVPIDDDVIRLGQFLKLANLIESGAEAKTVIAAGLVRVNDEIELRRGRQLRPGDVVAFAGHSARVTG